jgi:predicted Zn-dependent protease
MNAKLASIYDPVNATYARALTDWDDGGGGGEGERNAEGRPPPPTLAHGADAPSISEDSQREMRSMYDEAQDRENNGEFDEALDVLQRGVERFPNAAAFHNRIGVLLAMKKKDFEGAITAIQRAIDLDPDNLHYRNNLGKVMQRVRQEG